MSTFELRSLVVTTRAATTGLTTIDAVKNDLGITDTSEDEKLQTEIERASAFICGQLAAALADDGTVSLGRESLLETIYPSRVDNILRLSRLPIVSVESVTENGTLLGPDDYLISNNAGNLRRLVNGSPALWLTRWSSVSQNIVVTYTAGWLLPGDSGRNLPLPIEQAAIGLVKMARFNRARDPSLQSENILEGLYGYRLFDQSNAPGGVPSWIANLLANYRIYR